MKKLLYIVILLSLFSLFTLSASVVSLAPNITEIIFSLNMQNILIGRSEECNFPSSCLNITNVGSPWMPNIELIVSLKPDLVIASSLTSENSIIALRNAGIKTVRINNEDSIEGTFSTIEEISVLLDCRETGLKIMNDLKSELDFLKTKTDLIRDKKKAVYLIAWGDDGVWAATGNTFINDVLEVAGCINIASKATYWRISKELLLSSNPDYIFIPSYKDKKLDTKTLMEKKPYSYLKGKIVVIDGDSMERQGINTVKMTQLIAKTVYPELFI